MCCMAHKGPLHIAQLCMGRGRVTVSVCLSVHPHAAHLVLARNTTVPGCQPHDRAGGRPGEGQG